MTAAVVQAPPRPIMVTTISVAGVERISPSFVRIDFAGPGLARLDTDGPILDQRIKLIVPPPSGRRPRVPDTPDWYERWARLPEDRRGAMRTYSIRDLHGSGPRRRLTIDFFLHLDPTATGPAALWASRAAVGDQVVVVGPRRGAVRRGAPRLGVEFAPGAATRLLLAGDETAVPAISRILADLPAHAVGHAFLEVPDRADILPLPAPAGLVTRWLPRASAPVGARLIPAVLRHLGSTFPSTQPPSIQPSSIQPSSIRPPSIQVSSGRRRRGPVAATADAATVDVATVDATVDDTVWETPTYSSTGEEVAPQSSAQLSTGNGLYAWIAGESGVVTVIRRHLVTEVGIDRGQVAFMGYWRSGTARRVGRERSVHPIITIE